MRAHITVPVISARDHHCAAVVLLWLLRLHIHRAGSWCSPQKLIDTHITRQKFWHIILQSESTAINRVFNKEIQKQNRAIWIE
jgi:hypothetical protein